jgi:hypothetical protein
LSTIEGNISHHLTRAHIPNMNRSVQRGNCVPYEGTGESASVKRKRIFVATTRRAGAPRAYQLSWSSRPRAACSARKYDGFKAKGVTDIYILTMNDAFVTKYVCMRVQSFDAHTISPPSPLPISFACVPIYSSLVIDFNYAGHRRRNSLPMVRVSPIELISLLPFFFGLDRLNLLRKL